MSSVGSIHTSYDPRRQGLTVLNYKDPSPALSSTQTQGLETGRGFTQKDIFTASLRKAGHAPCRDALEGNARLTFDDKKKMSKAEMDALVKKPVFQRQGTEYQDKVHPPFLDGRGRWNQDGLPRLVEQSAAKALTTTGRFDGTMGPEVARPLTAVHSYADVSPVLVAEYARDTDRTEVTLRNTVNPRGTQGVYKPELPGPPTSLQQTLGTVRSKHAATPPSTPPNMGSAEERARSVHQFWSTAGANMKLANKDIQRIGDEVSTRAIAGTPNSRLVAGKWRNMPRPLDGAQLHTDYYGRCGPTNADYYGRTWHYQGQ